MSEIAWIGSLCLAVCGIPLAIEVYKKKDASHINNPFLILWTLGEILTLVYVLYQREYALAFNYTANLLTLLVVFYYKINPQK